MTFRCSGRSRRRRCPSRVPAGQQAPGFHAVADAAVGMRTPLSYALFGYVVGDVDMVTVTVAGRRIEASVATWSQDPQVHVWWVLGPPSPAPLPAADRPPTSRADLVEYDRHGVVLFGGPPPGPPPGVGPHPGRRAVC